MEMEGSLKLFVRITKIKNPQEQTVIRSRTMYEKDK